MYFKLSVCHIQIVPDKGVSKKKQKHHTVAITACLVNYTDNALIYCMYLGDYAYSFDLEDTASRTSWNLLIKSGEIWNFEHMVLHNDLNPNKNPKVSNCGYRCWM